MIYVNFQESNPHVCEQREKHPKVLIGLKRIKGLIKLKLFGAFVSGSLSALTLHIVYRTKIKANKFLSHERTLKA